MSHDRRSRQGREAEAAPHGPGEEGEEGKREIRRANASNKVHRSGNHSLPGRDLAGRRAKRDADIAAQWQQQSALLNSLLDTFTKCADQEPKGSGPQCDVYYAQVHQTSLDVLLSPVLASKLKAKLTATDIEDLKSTISLNMVNAYYYGKEKGAAAK